jgi:hypothetical protein
MDVMRDLLPLAAVVAFLCLVFMYAGYPVVMRLILTQGARPELTPFSLDDPDLPEQEARYFRAVIEELGPEGFEPVTGLGLPSQTPLVKEVLLLLVNRQTKDAAMAVMMYAKVAPLPGRKVFYAGFWTQFRDGMVVSTHNCTDLDGFPPRPKHTAGRFPAVRDAGRLYRLHRALTARSGSGDRVLRLDEEFGGDAAAYVAAMMVEELEDVDRAGYMALARDGKVYRPTWKGAFLMTWKELWPAKAIRRAARSRTARRLIAELESSREEWG